MNKDIFFNSFKNWNIIEGYENQDSLKNFFSYHVERFRHDNEDVEQKLGMISAIIESDPELKKLLIDFNEVFIRKVGLFLGLDFGGLTNKKINRSSFYKSDLSNKIVEWGYITFKDERITHTLKKDWNPFEETEKMISEFFSNVETQKRINFLKKEEVAQEKISSHFPYSGNIVDFFKSELETWDKNKDFLKNSALKYILLEEILVEQKLFSSDSVKINQNLKKSIQKIDRIINKMFNKINEKKMEEVVDLFDKKEHKNLKLANETIKDLSDQVIVYSNLKNALLEMDSIIETVQDVFLKISKEKNFTPDESDIFHPVRFIDSKKENLLKLMEEGHPADKNMINYFYYDKFGKMMENFIAMIDSKNAEKSGTVENEKLNLFNKEKMSLWVSKTILDSKKLSDSFLNDLVIKIRNKEIDVYSELEKVDSILKNQKPIKIEKRYSYSVFDKELETISKKPIGKVGYC